MTSEPLAPLFPLRAGRQDAQLLVEGEDYPMAPLVWNTWVENRPKPDPNPAPNRPEMRINPDSLGADTAALVAQVQALGALAQAMQQTTERVNEAHAQFLRNQEEALAQLQHIHTVLSALQDDN